MKYFLRIAFKFLIINLININQKLVRLLGFEPRTSWSVAKRSIQLSYRRIKEELFLMKIIFIDHFFFKIYST